MEFLNGFSKLVLVIENGDLADPLFFLFTAASLSVFLAGVLGLLCVPISRWKERFVQHLRLLGLRFAPGRRLLNGLFSLDWSWFGGTGWRNLSAAELRFQIVDSHFLFFDESAEVIIFSHKLLHHSVSLRQAFHKSGGKRRHQKLYVKRFARFCGCVWTSLSCLHSLANAPRPSTV